MLRESRTTFHRIRRDLLIPVDIASLVVFRIAFGTIMLWEVWRYLKYGWIRKYFVDPTFHFTYFGFEWVQPWPGDGMYIHFLVLGALALFIAIGFFYRLSAALFFVGFTYVFLLEQARYLNHFYLICLVSFILVLVPAHRHLSVDARCRPKIRSRTASAWALWILRIQVGIAYFYGGLAKLNGDWIRGEPMRMWLSHSTDFPTIGRYFTEEWAVYLFSYGGLLFDLAIVPLLLWHRTRKPAFLLAVLFHVTNARLFSIGIFPWFMIAATALFFPPDWPRRLLRQLRAVIGDLKERAGGSAVATTVDCLPPRNDEPTVGSSRPDAVLALLGVFVIVQLLFPLRHHLYPGDVNWTEEGHRFAWHMKLRDKQADALFLVTDPATNSTRAVDPRQQLESWQARKMATRPDMILQFARRLGAQAEEQGVSDVQVRALVNVSLNGRKPQPLVDPKIDLSAEPRTLMPAGWIVPLREQLPGWEPNRRLAGNRNEPGKTDQKRQPVSDGRPATGPSKK